MLFFLNNKLVIFIIKKLNSTWNVLCTKYREETPILKTYIENYKTYFKKQSTCPVISIVKLKIFKLYLDINSSYNRNQPTVVLQAVHILLGLCKEPGELYNAVKL